MVLELNFTGEKQVENIRLYIYQGNDCKFTLYKDGKYAKNEFNYNVSIKKLSINKREGEFSGMLEELTIITVSESSPIG